MLNHEMAISQTVNKKIFLKPKRKRSSDKIGA